MDLQRIMFSLRFGITLTLFGLLVGCGDEPDSPTPDQTPTQTPLVEESPQVTSAPTPTAAPTPTPTPSPTPQTDADEDGYFASDDCDDAHAGRYPGAPVACDGTDNNCDGAIELAAPWYSDADGDGFGDPATAVSTCAPGPNLVTSTGDCQDQDPSIYPGAVDTPGDGTDQDCGGTDAAEPCVGLGVHCLPTIQAGLDASVTGTTVFVGPGTYTEANLNFYGKAVSLVGTHGALETTVHAGGVTSPTFLFQTHEDERTLLKGFRITGSHASGIRIEGASPSLEALLIEGNSAELGGGLFLSQSSATLTDCRIQSNSATSQFQGGGGGIYLDHSSPLLDNTKVAYNEALSGDGGGLYLLVSHPEIKRSQVLENRAQRGGGMYLESSNPLLSSLEVNANDADEGGGIYLLASSPQLLQSVLIDNRALFSGGGLYLSGSSTSPTVQNTIFAWNVNYQIFNASAQDPATPQFLSCLLHSPYGYYHNFTGFPGEDTLNGDPGFLDFSADGHANDLLLPKSSALLIDKGAESVMDLDGSRSDLGLYGGPDADVQTLQDRDSDELFDVWEQQNALNPASPTDAQFDGDQDGLTNIEELIAATDPRLTDTDHDDHSDGDELRASTSPLDFYQQPRVTTPIEARVPGDFPSVQAAIDAVVSRGVIDLAEGTFVGDLTVVQREVLLRGDGRDRTILASAGGRTLRVQDALLDMSDLTLRDGVASPGANLAVNMAAVTASQINFHNGRAVADKAVGGGAWVLASSLEVEQLAFYNNYAEGTTEATGGGLVLERSSLTGRGLILEANAALLPSGTAAYGGGLVAGNSTLDLEGLMARGNYSSAQGGGVFLRNSETVLSQVRLIGNHAEGSSTAGGGLYALNSPLSLTYVWAEANDALGNSTGIGGALYIRGNTADLAHVLLFQNAAKSGGGLAVVGATCSLAQGVMLDNLADYGGGLFVTGTSLVSLEQSILAENLVSNVYSSDPTLAQVVAIRTDFYNPEGVENTGIPALEAANLQLEPTFVYPEGAERPPDLHLSITSALIDQGIEGQLDVDGTRADLGLYAGEGGDGWDLDGDGLPAWFWPGTYEDAPDGFSPDAYDRDDLDETVR